jgi:hypothetical protein
MREKRMGLCKRKQGREKGKEKENWHIEDGDINI